MQQQRALASAQQSLGGRTDGAREVWVNLNFLVLSALASAAGRATTQERAEQIRAVQSTLRSRVPRQGPWARGRRGKLVQVTGGCFASAEAAALSVARMPEARAEAQRRAVAA